MICAFSLGIGKKKRRADIPFQMGITASWGRSAPTPASGIEVIAAPNIFALHGWRLRVVEPLIACHAAFGAGKEYSRDRL